MSSRLTNGFRRASGAQIGKQFGMLAEGSIGSDGAPENDAKLLHGCSDDVRIVACFRRTLVEEIAIGAPCSRAAFLEGAAIARSKKPNDLVSLQIFRRKTPPPSLTAAIRSAVFYLASREFEKRAYNVAGPGYISRCIPLASAKHANGRDARLPRCFGIVGRVTNRDGIEASSCELVK